MKCKSFLNIDRSSGISSMPRAVRSQKDQRQEVRITRLGDHKTRWSCDYNSPPPHVIPAAAWLRCKYEKSVIRKSTRICPFNAKNRQDYSTASERLLEESRKYTKQPILLPGHCNQVDHKSLIISLARVSFCFTCAKEAKCPICWREKYEWGSHCLLWNVPVGDLCRPQNPFVVRTREGLKQSVPTQTHLEEHFNWWINWSMFPH